MQRQNETWLMESMSESSYYWGLLVLWCTEMRMWGYVCLESGSYFCLHEHQGVEGGRTECHSIDDIWDRK
jgi:hypothetical protein